MLSRCTPSALVVTFLLNFYFISATAGTHSNGENTNYPKRVFFGDLPLHFNISADAYSMGDLLLTSADAYRFDRGAKVIASDGLPAELKRPLDFLAVTDHAEFLGLHRMFYLYAPDSCCSPCARCGGLNTLVPYAPSPKRHQY